MCGFVTVLSKKNQAFPKEKLVEMGRMLKHRGPDDEGLFSHEDWLGMAFQRLALIDFSENANQPILSSDRRHAIIFSGELYNHPEIRVRLEKRGRVFKSSGDAEVALNAYLEWGKDCLESFKGMFAFVIADLENRSLFACRDPLGIKPLFHFVDNDYHFFCNEVKALLPYVNLEPDFTNLDEYLVFRFVSGNKTLFKGVRSVGPGECWELKDGDLRKSRYFSLADTLDPDKSFTFEENCEKVERVLRESVGLQLRSDAGIGLQLSGGVDSSLITALASIESGKKFHSFSIKFNEKEFDESYWQRSVAERYGTSHHDYVLDDSAFTSSLPESVWHYEHPLNDPSSVATMFLAKKAGEYVKIILSGDGADESFLGYARFNADVIKTLAHRLPLYRRQWLRKNLLRRWPVERGRSLLKVTNYHPVMYMLTHADMSVVEKLLHGNDSSMRHRHRMIDLTDSDVTQSLILQSQACDLPQWFWRGDRMGMAAGVETRVPFCDTSLFTLANSIPYEQHVKSGSRKAILKKIAGKYLDDDLIHRKKVGFGTPLDQWMRGEGDYWTFYEELVESERFKSRPFINHQHFRNLFESWKMGKYQERNCAFLWTYFNLELWFRIFFEGEWKNYLKK